MHVTNMGLNATAKNKENFLKEKMKGFEDFWGVSVYFFENWHFWVEKWLLKLFLFAFCGSFLDVLFVFLDVSCFCFSGMVGGISWPVHDGVFIF